MRDVHQIESELMSAQQDPTLADGMIEQYMPFIRTETAKFLHGFPADGQDELSIAMFAFYECMMAYRPGRGAFLHLAATAIRNRLIDHARKEQRNRGLVSLETPSAQDDDRTLGQMLAVEDQEIEQLPEQLASRKEIGEFAGQLLEFGVSLTDVADDCPKQERTMAACMAVLRYAKNTPELLEKMVRTKKLPLKQLAIGAGVDRKTIEHHRKYVLAILLAYTNGYEIIRGHLREVDRKAGNRQ